MNFYTALEAEPEKVKWLKGLALYQIVGGLFLLIWALIISSDYLSNVATFVFASLSINAGYLLWKQHSWGFILSMINFILQIVSVDFYGRVFEYTLTDTASGHFSLSGTFGYRFAFNPGVEFRNIGSGDEMLISIEVLPIILVYFLYTTCIHEKYKGY